MSREEQMSDAMVEAGRRLYERRILASLEGNLSVRLSDRRILTTPTGVNKGRLEPSELVVTDMGGEVQRGGTPSSELPMHLAIYRTRPDLNAVVHAHPPIATGYAVAGRPLPSAVLAEIVTLLGCVPVAPYGTPSTEELAEAVVEPIRGFDVLLLANHGAVATGGSLTEAEERMYQLEHFAEIALVSHLLGGPQTFSSEEVERLSDLRQEAGKPPVPAICYPPENGTETITLTRDELVELIADAVRSLD